MPIYLGFDSSTQGLTAIAIEVDGASRRVVFQRTLNFDQSFPRYGTSNGVLPQADPLVATSSPLMWAEALDRMMGHHRDARAASTCRTSAPCRDPASSTGAST